MNTIDLFREIMQRDLQECRGVCPECEGESMGLSGYQDNEWNHIGICFKEAGKIEEAGFSFDRARDIRLWKKHTPLKSSGDG